MARMARSYSSRALAIDRRVCISVLRGDSWPSRSWTVSSGRPAFRASVAQGAAWLSGSHHAAERDGHPKPVVAPRGHATSAVLARLYILLQAYATLRFRALGRWAVKATL
jgi:hypothetical protein